MRELTNTRNDNVFKHTITINFDANDNSFQILVRNAIILTLKVWQTVCHKGLNFHMCSLCGKAPGCIHSIFIFKTHKEETTSNLKN